MSDARFLKNRTCLSINVVALLVPEIITFPDCSRLYTIDNNVLIHVLLFARKQLQKAQMYLLLCFISLMVLYY